MDVKSSSILRLLPARDSKVDIKNFNDEVTIRSASELKSYRFDKVFTKSQPNSALWDYICRDKGSIISYFLSGHNVSIVTYGEVNSGKTYSLFGQEGSTDLLSLILNEIFEKHSGSLGISIWEVLYSPSDRSEKILDLLKISDFKPLPHTLTQDFISVEICSQQEGTYVFECAKELSVNWKSKSEGGFRSLNNRSHFFLRLSLDSFTIHVIDLAGCLPTTLSPEIRVKLGCDEQINLTRIGLNQFRSILWEMAKNPNTSAEILTASRKSKLALLIAPILALGKNYFLMAVKEDSEFEDIVKNLDVLQRCQGIKVKPVPNEGEFNRIPMSVFIQRHKVAKYWEFRYKDEGGEKEKEGKETKLSLKEQISQIINGLDEENKKKSEVEKETVVVNTNSFEVPESRIEQSFFKDRSKFFEEEVEEIKTTYELQIEDLKLENCNLRQKLRVLQDNSNLISIFKIYEDEIRKHEEVIKGLREAHIFNLQSFEKSLQVLSVSEDELSILQKRFRSSLKDLTNHIKSLEQGLIDKEKELAMIKKGERKWQLSRKCFENMTRKSLALESALGKHTKNLQSNENIFQEMIEELERLNQDNDKLQQKCQEFENSNEKMTEELKIMKEIASTSGMPEETLKRIHKNLQSPFKVQSGFVISLITRLQSELSDKKQQSFLDNVIHEVKQIATALEESQTREKNLFELLLELQKKLDKDDNFSKETNKLLRKTLLSQLL